MEVYLPRSNQGAKVIQPALKWHGGKSKIAAKIHKLAPPTILENPGKGYIHRVYGYAGGMGEMYSWDYGGISEVANDINQQITNFWRTMQDGTAFQGFQRIVEAIPFSRPEFDRFRTMPHPLIVEDQPNIEEAVSFFVRCRLSRSGSMRSFAPLSKRRIRRGRNEQTSAWQAAIRGLPQVHERVMRIAIECQDALTIITQEDTPRTLFYLDPTYLPEVVSTRDSYDFTMTEEQHRDLLDLVFQVKGYVMLSAYRSNLYDTKLKNWNRTDINVSNAMASAQQKSRRIESIYMNY